MEHLYTSLEKTAKLMSVRLNFSVSPNGEVFHKSTTTLDRKE